MPSTNIFDAQDEEYRSRCCLLTLRLAWRWVAGIADYWYKYVGLKGAIVGMTGYGELASADKLFPFFGFTAENIVAKAHKVLE
ncbi:transketolase-like TK C-terminal-containing protein [Escherichia coli]